MTSFPSTQRSPNVLNFAGSFPYGFYLVISPDERLESIVGNPDRYIELTLNPQEITVENPAATSIKGMQDGGLHIESKGGVRKQLQLMGTTGYLPPRKVTVGGTVPSVQNSAERRVIRPDKVTQARRSGFEEFHRLERMFCNFLDRRRENLYAMMHYMNFKDESFWLVEPQNLILKRSKSSPFVYFYTIPLTLIAPSDAVQQQTREYRTSIIPPTRAKIAQHTDRLTELRNKANSFLGLITGNVLIKFQNVLTNIENVVGVFDDLRTGVLTVSLDLPLTILGRARSSVRGMFDVLPSAASSRQIQLELNALLLESHQLINALNMWYLSFAGNNVGRTLTVAEDATSDVRGRAGLSYEVGQEDVDAKGSVPGLSILNSSYDAEMLKKYEMATQVKQVPINRGESIYSIAFREFGSIHAYVVLQRCNRLESPYIVPNIDSKPANTLAWGETIKIPVLGKPVTASAGATPEPQFPTFTCTVTSATSTELVDTTQTWREDQLVGQTCTVISGVAISDATRIIVHNTGAKIVVNRPWGITPNPGDKFTVKLIQFRLRKRPSLAAQIFGKDLLLRFLEENGVTTADVCLNSKRDLALVEGEENYKQALTTAANTEQSSNPFHPGFGLGISIGRRFDAASEMLRTFGMRQCLLRDPRTASVKNAAFEYSSGVAKFQANVQPVYVAEATYFQKTY